MDKIIEILNNSELVARLFTVVSRTDARYLYNNRKTVEQYLKNNNKEVMEVYFPCLENQNNDIYMNRISFYANGLHIWGFDDVCVDFYKMRRNNGYSYIENSTHRKFYDFLNFKSNSHIENIEKARMLNKIETKHDVMKVILDNPKLINNVFRLFTNEIYHLWISFSDNIDDNFYDDIIEIREKMIKHIGNRFKNEGSINNDNN